MIIASVGIVISTLLMTGINLNNVLSVTSYLTIGFISPLLGLVLGIVKITSKKFLLMSLNYKTSSLKIFFKSLT